MKIENRFAYIVLGTLGLAACGGGDTVAAGNAPVEGTGGTAEETGGASNSGGGSGRGGAAGSTGGGTSSSGGSTSSTGGSSSSSGGAGSGGDGADGGPGGAPGTGGTAPAAGGAQGTGGAAPTDGGTAPDGAPGNPDAGPLPDPAGLVAYAYAASLSAAAPYSPSATYSYNASGGATTIERTAVGIYNVDFANLAPTIRNAQATAYDHSGYCAVSSFGNTRVTVRCYDNDGALADARFSVAAFGIGNTRAGITAYAFADAESAAQYGANANYSFNDANGGIVAKRSQPGTYSLEFTNLTLTAGNVQLSAVNSNHHCSISSWAGSTVNAICYNELGQRADTKYLAMVVQRAVSDVQVLGFAHSVNSTDAQNDLTGGPNTFNANGGSVVAERTATGAYTVTFAGADFSTAHPQVTDRVYNKHCGITQWGSSWVKLACFDATGAASDSLFSLLVVK